MLSANYTNSISGLKVRAKELLQSLSNVDSLNDPLIEKSKATLNYFLYKASPNRIYNSLRMLNQLMNELEYSIDQLNIYPGLQRGTSGMSRNTVSNTLSGVSKTTNKVVPFKAMPNTKKRKTLSAKEISELKNPTTDFTSFIPYVVIGGIGLLVLYSGKKYSK